jgi:hypothetical protein
LLAGPRADYSRVEDRHYDARHLVEKGINLDDREECRRALPGAEVESEQYIDAVIENARWMKANPPARRSDVEVLYDAQRLETLNVDPDNREECRRCITEGCSDDYITEVIERYRALKVGQKADIPF